MNSFLDKTVNLVKLYQHVCGKSEIPKEYHFWSFLSLLAACVGDKVWLEKDRGKKLTPCLYVMLIGPSALGKSYAIGRVHGMMEEACRGLVKTYCGSVTAAHFIDFLGIKVHDEATGAVYVPNPVTWLVTDELANDIGRGPLADDFIKLMTKIYTCPLVLDTGTRTHGHIQIREPCVNWLVGSTKEWMISTLTGDTLRSGFGSRIAFIMSEYRDLRYLRATYPEDYDTVYKHILARLIALCYMGGQFVMTPEAEAEESRWYMNRKRPIDERLWPSWKRQQDLLLKVAMLLSLADGPPLVIDVAHVKVAKQLSEWVQRNMTYAVEMAVRTPVIDFTQQVADALEIEKVVKHSPFARKMLRRGIDSRLLHQIVQGLQRDEHIKISYSGTGGKMYTWLAKG